MTLALGFGLGVTRQFSVGGGIAPPTFDPTSLFGVSDDGGWYDVSDLATLKQDSGGTGAVSADGDPVGFIGDKSGKGHHLRQATSGARPTLRISGPLKWLEFTTNKFMLESITSFVPVLGTYLGAACKPQDNVTGGIIAALDQTSPSSVQFVISRSGGNAISANYCGFDDQSAASISGPNNINMYADAQSFNDAGRGNSDLRVNSANANGITNADVIPITTNQCLIGLNLFGSVGSSSGAYNFYAGIVINRALTAPERASCTTFFGAKAGLTL
ncbi:hypothetical protein FJ955_03100 [Mesorhizobium sp. B2-2-2]|uniref:hypothetical protein n=1 Tax=Mesorhizobium sp. B2-2-2 TaxID=2589964 RepID=UPI00112BD274|nr:hypothetical protein [Mesorhizobium sp. B2-2-2]TPM33742.1 hypothetical protein FJ955_03100 [Mesorhizobium sp. B2-2-2]